MRGCEGSLKLTANVSSSCTRTVAASEGSCGIIHERAEPDAEVKQLLERHYRRRTWTLVAAVAAVTLSVVSIIISVAVILCIVRTGLAGKRAAFCSALRRMSQLDAGQTISSFLEPPRIMWVGVLAQWGGTQWRREFHHLGVLKSPG